MGSPPPQNSEPSPPLMGGQPLRQLLQQVDVSFHEPQIDKDEDDERMEGETNGPEEKMDEEEALAEVLAAEFGELSGYPPDLACLFTSTVLPEPLGSALEVDTGPATPLSQGELESLELGSSLKRSPEQLRLALRHLLCRFPLRKEESSPSFRPNIPSKEPAPAGASLSRIAGLDAQREGVRGASCPSESGALGLLRGGAGCPALLRTGRGGLSSPSSRRPQLLSLPRSLAVLPNLPG